MGNASSLLEGIGRGRMGRIVMAKLAMDIDVIGGNPGTGEKGKDSHRVFSPSR